MVGTELPDLYAVLGVSPNADHDAIRKAYRRMAMQRHPDRGGSHARMVELITAWEILSDPEKRAHYDHARRATASQEARETATHEADEARTKAASFPQDWEEFERWQGDAWGEFTHTKTVTPRFLFILIGPALVAGLLREPLLRFVGHGWLFEQFPTLMNWLLTLGLFGILLSIFARLATALSTALPSLAPPREKRRTSYHGQRVIVCSGCQQQLRLPQTSGRVKITCPRCRRQEIHQTP